MSKLDSFYNRDGDVTSSLNNNILAHVLSLIQDGMFITQECNYVEKENSYSWHLDILAQCVKDIKESVKRLLDDKANLANNNHGNIDKEKSGKLKKDLSLIMKNISSYDEQQILSDKYANKLESPTVLLNSLSYLKNILPLLIGCSRNDTRIQERNDIISKEFSILKRLDKLHRLPYPLKRPIMADKNTISGYNQIYCSKVRLRLLPDNPETSNSKKQPRYYLTCYKPSKVKTSAIKEIDDLNIIPPNADADLNKTDHEETEATQNEKNINKNSKKREKDKKIKNDKKISGVKGTKETSRKKDKGVKNKKSKFNKNVNNNEDDSLEYENNTEELSNENFENQNIDFGNDISVECNQENKNQNANIIHDSADTHRLTTIVYDDSTKLADDSTIWKIIVFADDIVVLTNNNEKLKYKTIAMNTDLYGDQSNRATLLDDPIHLETNNSRKNRIIYKEEMNKLSRRDKWENKIRDFRIYDSSKLKDRIRKKTKVFKEELKRSINEQFLETRYSLHKQKTKLKETISGTKSEPLHVDDYRMAFRLVRCGRAHLFQSVMDPGLYLAVDHCPQPTRLRSSRFCKWVIEPVHQVGSSRDQPEQELDSLEYLRHLQPVEDKAYDNTMFSLEENKMAVRLRTDAIDKENEKKQDAKTLLGKFNETNLVNSVSKLVVKKYYK